MTTAHHDRSGESSGTSAAETAWAHLEVPVLIHVADEGGFWAEIPALPGCMTQGETREELLANLREAVEGWLAVAAGEAAPAGSLQEVDL